MNAVPKRKAVLLVIHNKYCHFGTDFISETSVSVMQENIKNRTVLLCNERSGFSNHVIILQVLCVSPDLIPQFLKKNAEVVLSGDCRSCRIIDHAEEYFITVIECDKVFSFGRIQFFLKFRIL